MRALKSAVAALTVFLVACGHSVDERFADMCEEQARDPSLSKDQRSVCKYGSYLEPADKAKLVDLWDQMKAQKAKVERLKNDLN